MLLFLVLGGAMMEQVHLILGGERSGKSSLAEKIASKLNLLNTYIATAQALDIEMQKYIARHQRSRPTQWQTVMYSLKFAASINRFTGHQVKNTSRPSHGQCVLIDYLTWWLTSCLYNHYLRYFEQEQKQLISTVANSYTQHNLHIILVSNEVGCSIAPMGDLSREFVDQAGCLHQTIAEIADSIDFIIAGFPLTLKGGEL